MSALDELFVALTAERFGPVVRDAERVPHLPLWLYDEHWREREDAGNTDDAEAISAHRRRREWQADYDRRRTSTAAARRLRVLTDDEIEAAS